MTSRSDNEDEAAKAEDVAATEEGGEDVETPPPAQEEEEESTAGHNQRTTTTEEAAATGEEGTGDDVEAPSETEIAGGGKVKEGGKEEESTGKGKTDGGDDDEEQPSIYEGKNKNNSTVSSITNKKKSETSAIGSEFPAPFYDPITKKLMKDPIVVRDGVSYERSTFDCSDKKVYPNRALKAAIDETIEMSGTSMRAGMKRLQHSMRKTFGEVLEKSIIPSEEYHPLPDVYYCPITFSLIHDPAIDPEGNTFERVAVENWVRANGDSPLTRTSMTLEDLYPNTAIKDLLDLEKNHADASIHPSIRKWKEEAPPQQTDPALGGSAAANTSQGGAFPTTPAELNNRRRRHQTSNANIFMALIFTVIVLVYAFIFLGVLGVIFAVGCILFCLCNSNNNDEE